MDEIEKVEEISVPAEAPAPAPEAEVPVEIVKEEVQED